ncbi:MAG: RrF2 family transcriptional regulator [Pseudomonadota bacterium]
MKLTARARSAVTALVDLAAFGAEDPVPLSDIALRQNLSVAFLEQIFGKLRRAGLVESRRGVGGGYVLAHQADVISVAQVVEAMEEEIRSTACQPGAGLGCRGTSAKCLTHGLWAELDEKIDSFLSGVTLGDVAKGAKMSVTSQDEKAVANA